MPGTVDDFMQRFGGAGTMDESEATHTTTALSRIMPTTANSTTTHTMRLQRNTSGSYLMISFVKQPETPWLKCLNSNVPGF